MLVPLRELDHLVAFYYYGRKAKLARRYPTATRDTIIEPFAGSAAYSCLPEHRERNVILVEKDEVVVEQWHRLLTMTDSELRSLRPLVVGERTSDPLQIMASVSKRWWQYRNFTVTPIAAANWSVLCRQWPNVIPQLRHWRVIHGDYHIAPEVEATWFIDPPYVGAPGDGYRHGSSALDYDALARWVLARRGQVIACEGEGADWLPFRPLCTLVGVSGKRSREMTWQSDDPTLGD